MIYNIDLETENDIRPIIDVSANLFYCDTTEKNGLQFAIVNSMFERIEQEIKHHSKDLVVIECYALGLAVNQVIKYNIDATIFVSQKLYKIVEGCVIDLQYYNLLYEYVNSIYQAINDYAMIYRMTNILGNFLDNKIHRIKISITPNQDYYKIINRQWKKGSILPNEIEY